MRHGAFHSTRPREPEKFEIAFPAVLSRRSPGQVSFPWMTRTQFDGERPDVSERPAKHFLPPTCVRCVIGLKAGQRSAGLGGAPPPPNPPLLLDAISVDSAGAPARLLLEIGAWSYLTHLVK